MDSGPQTARERLLETVRSGDWERVPAAADAYGAAVRADERRRTVDAALEVLKGVFGDINSERTVESWRDACLAAVEGVS